MISAGAANQALELQYTEQTVTFFKESFWCVSCCCFGNGCTSNMSPCCWGMHKCLCCHNSATSGEEFCGPLGCLSGLNKCLCYVSHSQFPPSPLMCGVCNVFLLGKPPTAPPVMTASQASQLAYLQNTFWLYYCCCFGDGCTCQYDNPVILGRQKCLCLMSENSTTDVVGPRGVCMHANKTCCCTEYELLPLGITPGIGLCNMLFLTSYPDARTMPATAPMTQMQMR